MAPVLLEGQRYVLTYTIPSYNTKWHEVSANAHTVFILSVHMVLKTREPHCKTVEVTLAFFPALRCLCLDCNQLPQHMQYREGSQLSFYELNICVVLCIYLLCVCIVSGGWNNNPMPNSSSTSSESCWPVVGLLSQAPKAM